MFFVFGEVMVKAIDHPLQGQGNRPILENGDHL